MSDADQPDNSSQQTEDCPHCGMLIDVTDQRAYARVHCPSCGGAMHVRRRFNNFEIIDIVGEGGMGTVYRAEDVVLSRKIALKVLREEYGEDEETIKELAREARLTASISHPHVVKVFSFGQQHGQYYIAMELVEKGSLDTLMGIQDKIAEAQVLNIGIQIAQGLEAAHEKGLIHCDVKPGNILFANQRTAKIVDFGLAVLQEHEAEQSDEIWGTPYYVPPERLNKEREDLRGDIYSLGGTLFHALSGRPPFDAENASLVALKHLKSKAVSLQSFAPDVSSETSYVINRMLKKDPQDRYDSYTELIEHLTYAREQLMSKVSTGQTRRQKMAEKTDQSSLVGGLVTLIMIAGLIVIGLVVWQGNSTEEEVVAEPVQEEVVYQENVDVEAILAEARRQIADGEFTKALVTLDQAGEVETIRQPLRNWIILSKGTAHLVGGNLELALKDFQLLADADLYSRDPSEIALANFFKETGRLIANERPIAANIINLYSTVNYEALAIFLFGIKDWYLGEYTAAAKIFGTFAGANPLPPYEWIADYHPLAEQMAQDYEAYARVREATAIKDATRPQLGGLRDQVRAVRVGLISGEGLVPALDALERDLNQRIKNFGRVVVSADVKPGQDEPEQEDSTATPAATPEVDLAAQKQELAGLAKLSVEIPSALKDNQLDALKNRLNSFEPETEVAKEQQAWLETQLDWLIKFRNTLISDFNTYGYNEPIMRTTGGSLEGKVGKADASGIEIVVPFGSMPISWQEIPVAEQLRLANHFNSLPQVTGDKQERSWIAAYYAHVSGLGEPARQQLLETARQVPEYNEALDRIFQ